MRLLLAALVLAATPAAAVGVLDAGPPELAGYATDLVERRAVLDLWDAGQPARTFALRLLPDGDPLAAEARARPVHGANATWKPLAEFRLAAGPDKKAEDRGWDGLYELAVRVRLPNQASARLALLLAPEAGGEGVALTTHLAARTLALRAWTEGDALFATVEGGKPPSAVEAFAGTQRWPMRALDGAWRVVAPPDVPAVRVVARFADGGVLEGPEVALPERGAAFPSAGVAPAPAPSVDAGDPEPGGAPSSPVGSPPPHNAPQERASARPAARSLPGVPISLALAALAGLALGTRVGFK